METPPDQHVFVGLIHGFGFSYIVNTMSLSEQITAALLYFNLGVEVGQILAVLVAFPALTFLFQAIQASALGTNHIHRHWDSGTLLGGRAADGTGLIRI